MPHYPTDRSVRFVLMLLISATGSVPCILAADGSPQDANSVVERLVSFEHGLNERMMDDSLKRDVQQLRTNPQFFAEAVHKALALSKDETQLGSPEYRLRLERALQLARLLGRDHGGPIVREFYDEIAVTRSRYSALETQDPRGSITENVRRVQWLTLTVLGDLDDTHAVDGIVGKITTQHSDDQYAQLEYLTKVAPLRPDIRPKLEEMYHSPTSPMRNNPQLKRVLGALDAAKKDRKPGENDRNQKGPDSKDE